MTASLARAIQHTRNANTNLHCAISNAETFGLCNTETFWIVRHIISCAGSCNMQLLIICTSSQYAMHGVQCEAAQSLNSAYIIECAGLQMHRMHPPLK